MKVKLKNGTKYWHWGDFSIRHGEEKECPKDILQYADGVLVAVRNPKKKEAEYERNTK